jgi:hypothetical protein
MDKRLWRADERVSVRLMIAGKVIRGEFEFQHLLIPANGEANDALCEAASIYQVLIPSRGRGRNRDRFARL